MKKSRLKNCLKIFESQITESNLTIGVRTRYVALFLKFSLIPFILYRKNYITHIIEKNRLSVLFFYNKSFFLGPLYPLNPTIYKDCASASSLFSGVKSYCPELKRFAVIYVLQIISKKCINIQKIGWESRYLIKKVKFVIFSRFIFYCSI